MKFTGIAAAALMGLSAGAVQAATVSYTDSYGFALTDFASADLSGNANVTAAPLVLQQFSGSQTLTGVTYQITAEFESDGTLTNNAANAQTFRFRTTADLLYSSILSGGFGAMSATVYDTGFVTLASGGSRSADFMGSLDTGVLAAAGPLGQYIGNGTFELDFETILGTAFVGGGGNITADQVTNARISATVFYEYDDTPPPPGVVPVPAALPLMASALGIFGVVRMRRRAG